jgi:hypothetical protein
MPSSVIDRPKFESAAANHDSFIGASAANDDVIDLGRLGRVAVGLSTYSTLTFLFDYPLFGAVIFYFGALKGSLIMMALSLFVDLCSIRIYDWSKKDWLALEFIRSHRRYAGKNLIRRMLRWILTGTPTVVQVIFLSLKFNAFIVTALLRDPSSSFKGLSGHDRGVFALSFITSQLCWSACIAAGVEGISWVVS